MPILAEPVDQSVARRLRACVTRLSWRTRRQHVRFQLAVCVGDPLAQARFEVTPHDALDHASRTEVVSALLDTVGGGDDRKPWVWIERRGRLEQHDADVAWLQAFRQATGEAGLDLVFVVVTRHGWRDPRSGVRREWLRPRSVAL